MLKAVTRSARLVDEKLAVINTERASRGQTKASVAYYFDHYANEDDTEVLVTEVDFTTARRELVPSVSLDELQHYERVRDTFEGVTKRPASNGNASRPSTARSAGSQQQNRYPPVPPAALKRAASSKNHSAGANGARNVAHPTTAGAFDSDDDYVVRTDKLSLNASDKGKGKKMRADVAIVGGTCDTNGAAEDLYD
jgi:peroxin-6